MEKYATVDKVVFYVVRTKRSCHLLRIVFSFTDRLELGMFHFGREDNIKHM
jgi:hypothetical protein